MRLAFSGRIRHPSCDKRSWGPLLVKMIRRSPIITNFPFHCLPGIQPESVNWFLISPDRCVLRDTDQLIWQEFYAKVTWVFVSVAGRTSVTAWFLSMSISLLHEWFAWEGHFPIPLESWSLVSCFPSNAGEKAAVVALVLEDLPADGRGVTSRSISRVWAALPLQGLPDGTFSVLLIRSFRVPVLINFSLLHLSYLIHHRFTQSVKWVLDRPVLPSGSLSHESWACRRRQRTLTSKSAPSDSPSFILWTQLPWISRVR